MVEVFLFLLILSFSFSIAILCPRHISLILFSILFLTSLCFIFLSTPIFISSLPFLLSSLVFYFILQSLSNLNFISMEHLIQVFLFVTSRGLKLFEFSNKSSLNKNDTQVGITKNKFAMNEYSINFQMNEDDDRFYQKCFILSKLGELFNLNILQIRFGGLSFSTGYLQKESLLPSDFYESHF